MKNFKTGTEQFGPPRYECLWPSISILPLDRLIAVRVSGPNLNTWRALKERKLLKFLVFERKKGFFIVILSFQVHQVDFGFD